MQIDFGDGNGSGIDFGTLDNGDSVGIECDGITVEEGDIDWGISTVELPEETGSQVYCFNHRNLFLVMLLCIVLSNCLVPTGTVPAEISVCYCWSQRTYFTVVHSYTL